MPGQRYPDLEEAAPVKIGEQMGGDILEAEPTGLGDGRDGEQEGMTSPGVARATRWMAVISQKEGRLEEARQTAGRRRVD